MPPCNRDAAAHAQRPFQANIRVGDDTPEATFPSKLHLDRCLGRDDYRTVRLCFNRPQHSMGDSQFLNRWAEVCSIRSKAALSPLLPFYGQSLAGTIDQERAEVFEVTDELNQALGNLIHRCASAKDSKVIVLEMRRLRVRAFRFSSLLFTSRRLLHVAYQRMKAQAQIDGIESEMRILNFDLNKLAIDEVLDAANTALGTPPKDLAWGEQWRSFFQMILLPLESKRRETMFGYSRRVHAGAIRMFISAATRDIYRAQCTALGMVIWRVIQPAIVPPMVGILILYAIHVTLELLGVSFLDLRLLSIVGIVASYPCEKVLERAFERWHLRLYGRACAHTAHRLFWAEVRARFALVGLVALSKAQPKSSED